MREFDVADLFCGAGGTASGAMLAIAELGARLNLRAINHWSVAVSTHALNHPDAAHFVQDLDGADPRVAVPNGHLDLLMASPECRYWSRASGGRVKHDQGRMNPWVVLRWLTDLKVKCLLVENVKEFMDWGPLGDNERPILHEAGTFFRSWIDAIRGLGYSVDMRLLNAADYGEATSRTRLFVQARADGIPIRWPEPTHSKDGATGLPWRGAWEIIDWSDLGRSLLDDPYYQKRPLALKTRERIAKGLIRFAGPLAQRYISLLDLPHLPQCPAPNFARQPFICANRSANAPRSMEDPVPPITTNNGGGIFLATPMARPCSVGQQYGTRPFISEYYSQSSARSMDEPLSAILATLHHGMVCCMCVEVNHGRGREKDPNGRRVHPVDEPLRTITTVNGQAIANATLHPDIGENGLDPRRIVYLDGRPHVLDIRFRMLRNPELARAMGFSDGDREYHFSGNAGQITKQIGNAVSVKMASALVKTILEDIG